MTSPAERPSPLHLAALFGLAAAVLAFEVLLLRLFELSHWHHFAGFAVSLALLGLGTAGTVLALLGRLPLARPDAWFLGGLTLAVAGLLLVLWLQAHVALRPLFATSDPGALARLLLVDLVAFLPFLGAGLAIGQALMRWPRHARGVYAANLLGSGAGSAAASGLLVLVHVEAALALVAAALAALGLALALARHQRTGTVACCLLLALASAAVVRPPQPAVSDFKALARLAERPGAEVRARSPGLAGRLTLFRADSLRFAPGLSLGWTEAVPAADAAVVGSDRVVPLARAYGADTPHARAMLAGLPLRLRPRGPVLALGAGEWQTPALAAGRDVTWVEPDGRLLALARARGAGDAGIRTVADGAWRHLARDGPRYGVIAFDGAHGGRDAATEDYLMTVAGMARALDRLEPGGLLAIPLAQRYPPRHFTRLMTTLRAALARAGVTAPGGHVAVVRGLQALLVLASPEPLAAGDRAAIRAFAERWRFDLAWLGDLGPDEVNRYHRLEEPLFHRVSAAVLDDGSLPGAARWFVTAPADLDRPYLWHSLAWSRLPDFVDALGPATAVAYLDWTLLLGAAATLVVTVLALVLIVAPLGRLPPARPPPGRAGVLGYFAALGLGYMLLELALFQRAILFLGEPVLAASVVFAVFLVGSGLGSALAPQALERRAVVRIFAPAALGLVVAVLGLWAAADALVRPGVGARIVLLAVLLLPLAWALGRPFPWALRQLAGRQRWVPWAWGINGFASVAAASAAPLVSVHGGQPVTLAAGAACYLLALAIALRWTAAPRVAAIFRT